MSLPLGDGYIPFNITFLGWFRVHSFVDTVVLLPENVPGAPLDCARYRLEWGHRESWRRGRLSIVRTTFHSCHDARRLPMLR